LHQGQGVAIDCMVAGHYLKLAADQGYANAQYNHVNGLKKGEVVEIDFKKQHMISNLLPIKDLRMLNSIMDFVCRKVKVLELILKEQHIILNLLLIKDLLLVNIIVGFVCRKMRIF
jgi:TPR repeat protein